MSDLCPSSYMEALTVYTTNIEITNVMCVVFLDLDLLCTGTTQEQERARVWAWSKLRIDVFVLCLR